MSGAPPHVTVFTDGAARGNPGPAAIGVVALDGERELGRVSRAIGTTTSNVAEYQGLIASLELAVELGARSVLVKTDSQLLARQWTGEYRIRARYLQLLHARARQLAGGFASVRVEHVSREANRRADQLCNQALDRELAGAVPRAAVAAAPASGTASCGDRLAIFIDSTARGNPGPAAVGAVALRDGCEVGAASRAIGTATDNAARYHALVAGLELAAQLGDRHLEIHTDSELLVRQWSGQYKVRAPHLKSLHARARQLAGGFSSVCLRQLPRGQNLRAEALCRQALGGAGSQCPGAGAGGDSTPLV